MDATHDALLSDVERFLADSGMTPTAFGQAAVSDPRFVFDLRQGRECRRATREKVVTYIAERAVPPKGRAA